MEVTLDIDSIIILINIGAMILTGLLGAVFTGGIGYFFGIRNIRRDLGVGTEAPLTKQHSTMQETLTRQHNELKTSQSEIRHSLDAVGQKVEDISHVLLEEKTKQQYWHNNLSESQKELKASTDKIGQFVTKFDRMASEAAELRKENEKLRVENMKLEERYSALIGRIQVSNPR